MTPFLLLVLTLAPVGASVPSDTTEVRPAPRVSGRVIDRAGNPIAGARIAAGAKVLARTDASGRFAFAVPATENILIEATPYASRTVHLDPSSYTLGDVALLRAGSVSVDTSKIRGLRELTLVPLQHRRDPARTLRRKASGSVTLFTGLEPGNYLLTARGAGPLQQKSQLVEVGEGAMQQVAMTIDRMPISGYVFLGREPLPHADVQIIGPGGAWEGHVRTDAEGEYAGELWQVGPMQAVVTSPKLTTEFLSGHRSHEALQREAVEWHIAVPDRKIVGRVVDDRGNAVAKAPLSIEVEDGEVRSRINILADSSGAFEYAPARSGRYSIEATPRQHLKPAPLQFELRDDDPNKRVEIVMERGAEVRVRVTREDGTPIADALIADGVTEDGSKPLVRHRTNAAGEATLRGRPGDAKTIYVIPPQGSFAVAHLTLDPETLAQGADVVVPEPKSALVIRTRDESGAALGGIQFAVRYNGELLPPAILLLIRSLQHVDYRTTAAGEARIHGLPSGMYELWAYRTASEGNRLAVNPDGYEPALQLALAQGTYEADLTFGK